MILVPTAWPGAPAVVPQTHYMRRVANVALVFQILRLVLVVLRLIVEDFFWALANVLYAYLSSDIFASMIPALLVLLTVCETVYFGTSVTNLLAYRIKLKHLIDAGMLMVPQNVVFFSPDYPSNVNLMSAIVIFTPVVSFGIALCAVVLYRSQQSIVAAAMQASDLTPLLQQQGLDQGYQCNVPYFHGEPHRLSSSLLPPVAKP
eukprot:Polyplicarium_translucidae@DN3311_c1_g1_i3.p1